MKIKSRNEILNDIIRDAEKTPRGWKAVFGKDNERLSRYYYIFHPNIGIYLLKEYQKNPFEVTGVGEKIARQVDEDANGYKSKRAAEYPSIPDQLDDIYHNGIDAWKATIKVTKDKYPKP